MAIDRVVRRARSVALAFGAVVAGSVVTVNLLPVQRLRELPGWFLLVPISLWILLPLSYVAVFWSAAGRPAPGFRISRHRRQRAFVVLNIPLLSGPMFIVNAFVASNVASQRATRELFDGTTFLVARAAELFFAALLVGLGLWSLYRVGPLRLTQDALIRPFRRTIPWDDLAPDGPSRQSLQGAILWLLLRHRTVGSGPHSDGPAPGPPIGYEWYPLDLRGSFVNREFLTTAIRYYRDNPAARATIGTPEGLQQLLNVIAAPENIHESPGSRPDGRPSL